MTLRLNTLKLAFALLLAVGGKSFAQKVITTTVGQPANFEISSKVFNRDITQCSMVVTRPNGSTELVTLKEPDFRTSLSFTPTVQGSSEVSWRGEVTLNGKIENPVVGGVKQLFNNLGEVLTLSGNLSKAIPACPGEGVIVIVAMPREQPLVSEVPAPITPPVVAIIPPQVPNRLRSTANIPTVMNPPIENSAFRTKYNNDSTYRKMVDDFNVNRSKQSLTALRLYSELGDSNAQFLYGLAHMEDWTGLYNPKLACYWIREAAVQGLSQARLVLASRAVYNKDCFDVTPTLDEAKTWAQLASASSDRAVKENAEKLIQDILRIQISNQR
jgi:hypothetical protein